MDDNTRTLYCGNLSDKVTEEILYELFLQGGPVQRVTIPKDRDGKQRAFGFVTYKHLNSVSYALDLFNGTTLFNRPISINARVTEEAPQTENLQDYNPNLQNVDVNELLRFGREMLLGNGPNFMHPMNLDNYSNIMIPNNLGSYSQQHDFYSAKNDRRSRQPPMRMHPYNRDQGRNNNRDHRNHRDHKDHWDQKHYRSRNNHSNHRSNDYSRHDYKNNRRNYH